MNNNQQEVSIIIGDILAQYQKNPQLDLIKLLGDATRKMTKEQLNYFNQFAMSEGLLELLGWEEVDPSEIEQQQFISKPAEKELVTEWLPPWQKYPDIPCYSIGWRMGAGEDYMFKWHGELHKKSNIERINYFKQYLPIPIDWVVWVGDWCGYSVGFPITDDKLCSVVAELEKEGLANLNQYKEWQIERKKAKQAEKEQFEKYQAEIKQRAMDAVKPNK